MGYVYVFEFPNGKRYVGATTLKIEYRWNNGKKYTGKVREAIDLFGWDNVKKHTWEVQDSKMDDIERFLISVYKSTDPDFGYNTQTGGKSGYVFSNYKNPMYGKHHSEEAIRKMSESHMGKHESDETRRKKSEAQKGNRNAAGWKRTEEYRKKMSEAKKLWWETKKGLTA